MSFTQSLLIFFIVAILGLIFGVLKKNKIIFWISSVVCILVIGIVLFLMFVLIPAM